MREFQAINILKNMIFSPVSELNRQEKEACRLAINAMEERERANRHETVKHLVLRFAISLLCWSKELDGNNEADAEFEHSLLDCLLAGDVKGLYDMQRQLINEEAKRCILTGEPSRNFEILPNRRISVTDSTGFTLIRSAEQFFNGICPYTDKPCDDWNCEQCEVEAREREYLGVEE